MKAEYALGETVDFKFETFSGGEGVTLSGSPALACYKSNSTTQSTAGITLTVDFDAITGLNHVRILTTDAFYTLDDYNVVITQGTVGGLDQTGRVVGSFAITRQATAADTIDYGTVDTAGFTPTTTEFETSTLTEATADHYKDRVVVWHSGNLARQGTSISAYSLAGGRGHFTVAAMTEAPASGDRFVIV